MAMTDEKDPLRRLLLDAAEIDRAALAEALAERVGIDTKTGRIALLPGYATLNSRQKALAVVLAAKAAFLLEIRENEAISASELTSSSGLPSGTAGPSLRELNQRGLAAQTKDRAYYVPNARLKAAIEALG